MSSNNNNNSYSFESEHQGIVHDTQYDYYGKRLATAGSDGKINIYSIGETQDKVRKLCELNLHQNSIWQLAWTHPRFGNLLASCGYDKKIIICKETSANQWEKIYEYNEHQSSVNSIAFAPQEYGLILLAGSSDGSISLHEYKNDQWISRRIEAHKMSVNSVCWGPAFFPISFMAEEGKQDSLAPLRFVTGSCDNLIKVWTNEEGYSPSSSVISTSESRDIRGFKIEELEGHEDWVRSVDWLNYPGYKNDLIASCGEDGNVFIWIKEDNSWNKHAVKKFNHPVWKVSWSHCGSYLAVSGGDNVVYIFKETSVRNWEIVSQSNNEGLIENTGNVNNN